MSVAISPAVILERAAWRMNLPAFSTTGFVTSAHALTALQDACERLSGLLIEAHGAPHFSRQATLATQAGVDVVSLPAGIARIEAVYWLAPRGSSSVEVRMTPAYRLDDDLTPVTWDRNLELGTRFGYDVPSYRVEGNVLVLRPVPLEVYTLRVDYQDTPTIASLADTIYGQAGWAEWLVLDLCEQIATREEKDPSVHSARKAKVEMDLREQGANRDRGQRVQVTDAWAERSGRRPNWYNRGRF